MQSHAQTTVADNRTTPAVTSTTGDLTINSGAGIKVITGDAVTVDSPNTLVQGGAIDITDSPTNSTGVLVTSTSGTVVNTGTINVTDTEVLKDTDGDGDLDGPYVTASTTRFGIHVINPFNGPINESAGQITIRGNNSAAIAIENGMTGDLTVMGTNTIVGSNSYGIRVNGPFVGAINIGGSVTAQGQNAEAISIFGPVTGRVIVQRHRGGHRVPLSDHARCCRSMCRPWAPTICCWADPPCASPPASPAGF